MISIYTKRADNIDGIEIKDVQRAKLKCTVYDGQMHIYGTYVQRRVSHAYGQKEIF